MIKYPSLNQRTYQSSRIKPWTNPTNEDFSAQPMSYRESWDDETMKLALSAKGKEMSVHRAASEYNITNSTLGDKPDRKPYFTPNEVEELVKFLVNTVLIGYGCSRKKSLQYWVDKELCADCCSLQ